MAGVILRTAGGTLLFAVFLWLVRVDDYRVAGMLLTFPMLNGIGLLGAGPNAGRLAKSMTPVVALNGGMCFALRWVLAQSQTARAHPGLLIALTTVAWLGVYAVLETRNVAFTRSSSLAAFAAASVAACLAITCWVWPPCASVPTSAVLRADGLAGVLAGWVTVALFAASLAILFGFAHRFQHAHAAIGRLAALPIVPLFGLYTAATVLWSDPAAPAKLETMRSMVMDDRRGVRGGVLPIRGLFDLARPRHMAAGRGPHRRLGALPWMHRGIGEDRDRACGLQSGLAITPTGRSRGGVRS